MTEGMIKREPDCCGEEGVKNNGQALDLTADLCSRPYLRP